MARIEIYYYRNVTLGEALYISILIYMIVTCTRLQKTSRGILILNTPAMYIKTFAI